MELFLNTYEVVKIRALEPRFLRLSVLLVRKDEYGE
jgi:hypothetical protein